jgi:hypothetical protein
MTRVQDVMFDSYWRELYRWGATQPELQNFSTKNEYNDGAFGGANIDTSRYYSTALARASSVQPYHVNLNTKNMGLPNLYNCRFQKCVAQTNAPNPCSDAVIGPLPSGRKYSRY